MKVLKLIFFFLFILKNSATGQIVTPSLDASVLSLMPASAGWRDETNFNGSFESFAESDLEGNESTASDVSYMVSSKLLYKSKPRTVLRDNPLVKIIELLIFIQSWPK